MDRVGPGCDLAAQQVTAVRVGNGERIAALAVGGAEPAFEVGAPGLIGGIDGGERLPIRRRADPRLAPVRQAGPFQYFADGAFRRPYDLRLRGGEFDAQFSRPPVPALARGNDLSDDVRAELVRAMLRRAAAVGEPRHARRVMALEPLVDGLARHAINLGKR